MKITQETLPKLGNLLYKKRKDMGLSQKQVGEKAGISHVTVCRIERGEIDSPRFADIAGMCEAVGLEIMTQEKTR